MIIVEQEIENFKTGLIELDPIHFGKVGEFLCHRLFNMLNANVNNYDGVLDNLRIECKFSRAFKKRAEKMTIDNIIQYCLESTSENKLVESNSTEDKYDCNIQQVKPVEFDQLYYGVIFKDKIQVFKINSDQVENIPGYSNKQHRGNVGEGQFHITNGNIQYHRDNYFIRELSFEDLYNLFRNE